MVVFKDSERMAEISQEIGLDDILRKAGLGEGSSGEHKSGDGSSGDHIETAAKHE